MIKLLRGFVLFFCVINCQGQLALLTHDETNMTGDMIDAVFCETVKETIYTLKANEISGLLYWLEYDPKATPPPIAMCNANVDGKSSNGLVCMNDGSSFHYEVISSYNIRACVSRKNGSEQTCPSTSSYPIIRISEANTYTPLFLDVPYITYQLEGSGTVGKLLQTVSAQDRDTNYPGSVSFTLDSIEYTALQAVPPNVNPDTSTTSQNIMLIKELDYENSQIHVIIVTATDGGRGCDESIPVRSSNTTFFLNVLDGPDQPPVFTDTNPGTTQYTATVNENCAQGTPVKNVSAIDRDYSLNWGINYTLLSGMDVFAIDSSTGEITVIGSIDRESGNIIYELKVQATEIMPSSTTDYVNFEGLPMSGIATVIINVIDEDDSLPTFYQSSAKEIEIKDFTAFLEEETPNTLPISNLSVYISDDDLGDNAQFNLSLAGADSATFTIEPEGTINNEATVTVRVKDKSQLDFETRKELSFQIVAQSIKGNKTLANVLIKLIDINDNYPKFEQAEFVANISEDSCQDEITTIEATDNDTGVFSVITYSLSPNDIFDIYPDNGTVYYKQCDTLDRETRSSYFVTVRATDGGGFITTSQLEIDVLDVNDNDPQFQQNQYSGNWQENQDADSVQPVLVYASDRDDPDSENSNITYEFTDEESKKNFTIETINDASSTHGEIKPNGPLDTEALVGSECSNGDFKYILGVRAVDGGTPQRSDTVNVTLYIQDLNDFAPVFNSSRYDGSVQEESPAGTQIVVIAATDGDICESNNQITYSVDPDTYSNLFSVEQADDGSYGVLVVKSNQIDRDTKPFYKVSVLAVDNGQNRNQGNTTVNVTITDKNNKNPVFDPLSAVEVGENAAIGTDVANVTATDSDEDSNLTYKIMSISCENDMICANWFEIYTVSQIGIIKVNSTLDREAIQKVTLTLEVKDENAADGAQTDEGTIEITLGDYNDNPPKFSKDSYVFNGAEGNYMITESFVEQITATDADQGINAEILFTIQTNSYATIDETGRLSLNGNIDREGDPGSNFTVVVIATDQGTPKLSTNTSILFIVDDINDNDPEFGKTGYNCTIAENEAPNTVVCRIVATDKDIGDNGIIIYSLNDISDFTVDNNGNISSQKSFNYEAKTTYSLKLKATDRGGDSARSTEVDLTIYIRDTDDNDPEYTENDQQNIKTSENEQIGTVIGKVSAANDIDSPEFSKNYYFLAYVDEIPAEPYFSLDKESRDLSNNVVLDREKNDSITLYVLTSKQASLSDIILDSNNIRKNESVLEVLVDITDDNDEVPVFTSTLYRADILSDSTVDTKSVVTSVAADDNDEPGVTVLQYNITNQIYENTNIKVISFSIRTVEGRGDIFIAYPIIPDEGGSYLIDLEVNDGANVGKSQLRIKVIVSVEQVIMESRYSVAYLTENQDELEKDLEDILNADVVIDKIIEHGLANQPASRATGNSSTTSDVYFHATEWNSTTIVSTETIINEIDIAANEDFLRKWAILNLDSGSPAPDNPATENDILKSALVVVCCLIIVILVVYTTAFFCMSKNYQRKLRVAKASGNYVKDMEDFAEKKNGGRHVPNTNNAMAGDNPLFEENQNGKHIDIDQLYSATSDNNSIDDNEVDSQDSAIDADENGRDVPNYANMDNEQDWEDVDIDFNEDEADTTRLQAALAQRRQGGDNIVLMFDNHGMDNTSL